MAKVGRAARVASRQRAETITGDKVIASAETGELYFISVADSANITLPALQDGAYFKLYWIDNQVGQVAISGALAADTFKGRVLQERSTRIHGANHAHDFLTNSGYRSVHPTAASYKLAFPTGLGSGSCLEIWCDGSNWIVDGTVTGSVPAFS